MIYIIETDQNFEAGCALCNKIVKELNKGVIMSEEDLDYFETLAENVSIINKNVHKEVIDVENRRYGGSKCTCDELKTLIAERRKAKEKEKEPDFNSMSKEELIAYIKSNEAKKVEDEGLVLKNPTE